MQGVISTVSSPALQVSPRKKPLVSIVIPVYNEEANVLNAFERVKQVFAQLPDYDFECVFTDNHSTDSTFQILRTLASEDERVRAWRFSRNFGYQKSILTAYLLARGDCAIQLDCDLQDPPEMIPQFLDYWKQGYKIVYGIRRSRQESRHIEWMRKSFYRLVDFLSPDPLPHDAGDFRLIDRDIVKELDKVTDYHVYIRGRLATMGFKQKGIPYDRAARMAGESKFRFSDMVSLAVDAILSHSIIPLRFATWTGLAAMCLAVVLTCAYFVVKVFYGDTWPAGFMTLLVLIMVSIGLNGLLFGIMGEYVARLYQQIKLPVGVIVEESTVATPKNQTSEADLISDLIHKLTQAKDLFSLQSIQLHDR